ncbi:hypothetical protein MO973_23400 [Paenibacillus sp. TRM 82003]|nr:hypothetical protein [Paenibacillus sp. TRM 82003]
MKLIPYYDVPPEPIPDGSCVHLSEPVDVRGNDIWIESYDAALAIEASRTVSDPVLNSLSLDEAPWEASGVALDRFRAVVLLPYRPGVHEQDYDANLAAISKLADRYGLERERRIVDVCILPMRVTPDASLYAKRISRLSALGFATCGGVNNYIHEAPELLLPQIWSLFSDAGLTYGLVSAPLADKYGLASL